MRQADYELLQLQGIVLEIALISASEVKEYKEDWRKTPVLRQGGRFASSVKTAVVDTTNRAEQGIKSSIEALSKQIEEFRESLSELGGIAQQKLRNIFQSKPMDEAKEKIGVVLEEVSPEAKEAFDEINNEISSALNEGDRLDEALAKAQKKAEDNLKKSLDSIGDSIKERQMSLLAMGIVGALTATTGAAGLLIGAGAVGTVANWSVPNLLGKAKEFATTKALLENDKDLFNVWGAEFDAEFSQFLFRASLITAGVGALILGEELLFDALEEDKKTFAQGVKVLSQGAISGIAENPVMGASQEDVNKLGEYFKESQAKRLGSAKNLSKEVGERAQNFARGAAFGVVDAINPLS